MSAHTDHTFGGSALDRMLFDFEVSEAGGDTAAATAPAGDPSPAADAATSGDGGAVAGADAGAAVDAPAAAPAPIDWTSQEARQAFEQFQADREAQAAAQAQAAEQAQRQQSEFDDIREAFGLLGIAPERFDQFLQASLQPTVAPLSQAAQQLQAEQQVREITAHLEGLGSTHPDLLGDGVQKLSEYVGDDGQPLFNIDDVKQQNQSAVISATVGILEASKGADGNPTIPWTVAADHAAKAVAARDQIVAKAAVEQFKRQLQGTSSAATDITGTGAGGAARVTGIEGGDELAVANRWLRENRG